MRACPKCGKENAEFYEGVPSRCKDCHKTAIHAARQARAEYYREYDRLRASNPERIALRQSVAKRRRSDPELHAVDVERGKAWQERNRLKRQAHIIVGNAIKDGTLEVKPCERCGFALGIQAHHEAYSKPLDVTWLCTKCHGERHREINEERRKAS